MVSPSTPVQILRSASVCAGLDNGEVSRRRSSSFYVALDIDNTKMIAFWSGSQLCNLPGLLAGLEPLTEDPCRYQGGLASHCATNASDEHRSGHVLWRDAVVVEGGVLTCPLEYQSALRRVLSRPCCERAFTGGLR
ncbi:hypothetical protein PoB_002486700 [Plakobranchus ocellatus]|uniref:Uncharacterized protein n=1 Tax=Plakobranchus ocellatus TaxID=259542 RepID=A0AAV3ZUY6_9GAST|nr:hypothetical protein PoB_002486700 [Plakobranchus ocellatus]